jgi:hypothetical protein
MMAFIVNYVANREPIDRHANITTTISFSNLIIASSAVARAARQHVSLANSKIHAKRIAVNCVGVVRHKEIFFKL